MELACRVVEEVRSLDLARVIVGILAKLREASKSSFIKHVESFGLGQAVKMVQAARGFGSKVAREWLAGGDFARYLAFIDFNQPSGWGVSSGVRSLHYSLVGGSGASPVKLKCMYMH